MRGNVWPTFVKRVGADACCEYVRKAIEKTAQTGAFVCPISLPTFFKLDSMTSLATRNTLRQFVDELSQGLCIAPFHDRVGSELRKLRLGDLQTLEALKKIPCSPIISAA